MLLATVLTLMAAQVAAESESRSVTFTGNGLLAWCEKWNGSPIEDSGAAACANYIHGVIEAAGDYESTLRVFVQSEGRAAAKQKRQPNVVRFR